MGFYHPPTQLIQQQLPTTALQQHPGQRVENPSVITINSDKEGGLIVSIWNILLYKNNFFNNLLLQTHQQSPIDTSMSIIEDTKPELGSLNSMQQQHHGPARGSKPQACKVCGKMLSSASSYYVHMKLHSGTKPFQCTVCEAAFCRFDGNDTD